MKCGSQSVRKRLKFASQTTIFMGGYYINIRKGANYSTGLWSIIRSTVIGMMLRYQ